MLDFKKKPIIAMLHMKSDRKMTAQKRMELETDIYTGQGVDAVLVENYFGSETDCERGLAWLQKNRPNVCYGVNILGDYRQAFRLADKYGASFIQIDSVCGHLLPRQDAAYGQDLQALEKQYPHIQVLGGVRFKYQPIRSGRTLKEDLQIGAGRCSAVVTTGDGTGIMTPTEKLVEFRELLGDFPLVVGAGVTAENVKEQLRYADAVIIGSWLKDYHNAECDVSEANVRIFMEQVRAYWSEARRASSREPSETDRNQIKIEKLAQGLKFENENQLEEAYQAYREAADAGNPAAMYAIGNLYLYKNYKGIEQPPLSAVWMPWDSGTVVPDLKTAFAWFLKSAEAGYENAMSNVGVMLYQGQGCDKNEEEAKKWLLKAAVTGNPYATKALKDFFKINISRQIQEETYDEMLDQFCAMVEAGNPKAQSLWEELIQGEDTQLVRLGYRLAVGKYNVSNAYAGYSYPNKSNGRSCAPVTAIRAGWVTVLILNCAAFGEKDPVISISSDICSKVTPVCGVKSIGAAGYEAESFGWLKRRRKAHLLQTGNAPGLSGEEIEELQKIYGMDLIRMLYELRLTEDEALFIENGEKEFSVEIGHLTSDTVKIIHRYTIGGWDQGDRVSRVWDFEMVS